MTEIDNEAVVKKIVLEPRISLTMISRFIIASEKAQASILKKCKYPSDYIPKFYELARKLVCEIFESNFIDGHELYFETFKNQAKVFRDEAKNYDKKRDAYKNRIYSAKGLDDIVAMSNLLLPILKSNVLKSNLHLRRNKITKNGVRVGAMADMVLLDQIGDEQVGFIKFVFETKKLKEKEAQMKLCVLHNFYKEKKLNLDRKYCILVDVIAWKIYSLENLANSDQELDIATKLINQSWESL